MNFEYRAESLRTPALILDYHLVPWDTQLVRAPVAQISNLRVFDASGAARDYEVFSHWCEQQEITLCACRLPEDRLVESMFLEERGFRFIELNYTPQLKGLQALHFPTDGVIVEPAGERDRGVLADMAGQVFRHGRFHQDPRIDPKLGDRRYRYWMENAFASPSQDILKCVLDGKIVGFFVTEQREAAHCFWSLVGLAPGLAGKGLGKRVWKAVLGKHRSDGVDAVSTSISSLNSPVFNLYVSLGFRFPQPAITLQWRPVGVELLT